MLFRSLLIVLFFVTGSAFAADRLPAADSQQKLDLLISSAISDGLIAGGIVLIGDHDKVLFQKAYGKVSSAPDAGAVTFDTIFDIASLTKVIATTPAVLKLMDEGKLGLLDPVEKWYPEFNGHMKDDLLIVNLLTHTSGLCDFPLSSENAIQSAVNGAAFQKLKGEVWSGFRYADINFIILADLVKKVSGTGLDAYAANYFFKPMGMKDTCFNPGKEESLRCAATLNTEDNTLLFGQVQDYAARQLGGVAGHAGLFSTAADLARFCRMILNGGEYEGTRILSRRVIDQMTAPYFSRGGKVIRGLGWDIHSPYSSPRGGFSSTSFGHTGYSGSSVWIDPANDLFAVFLTSRLDYKNTRYFNRLRDAVSTLAVEMFVPVSSIDQTMAGIFNQRFP